MSNIIKQLEQEQMKQDVPSFRPGDTVEVNTAAEFRYNLRHYSSHAQEIS